MSSMIVEGKSKVNRETATVPFWPRDLFTFRVRQGVFFQGEMEYPQLLAIFLKMQNFNHREGLREHAEETSRDSALPDIPRDPYEQEFVHTSTQPVTSLFDGARRFNIDQCCIENNAIKKVTVYNGGNRDEIQDIPILEKYTSFDAIHNSSARDPTCKVHPGTRQYVLKCIQDWIDDRIAEDRILWLHGPTGVGKSAIAQTIACTYAREKLPATFFFNRSDPSCSDGNRLFTTLTRQFAFSIPFFRQALVDSLNQDPDILKKDVETQFEGLIVKPFLTLKAHNVQPSTAPVVIIDGVDECSDDRLQQRFLKIIGNAVKDNRVPVRFLICGRPEAYIKDTIDIFRSVTLSLDLAELHNTNEDMEKYLRDEFSRIANEQCLHPAWPGDRIIEKLVYKASGQFLYASTVIKYVDDKEYTAEDQLNIILKLKPCSGVSPFAGVDKLYQQILTRKGDQVFLKVFLLLLIGRMALRSGPFEPFHEDDAMLMGVSEIALRRRLCGMHSVLKFDPYIDVHHQSFLDFLQDKSRSGQYHISEEAGIRQYVASNVDWFVKNAESMIERQGHTTRFHPKFLSPEKDYLMSVFLPVDQWKEALQPVLQLWNKLLTLPDLGYIRQPPRCPGLTIMRFLLFHLGFFTGISGAAWDYALMEEPSTIMPLVSTETETNALVEEDLDGCLSLLLSRLRKRKLGTLLDTDTIKLVCFLLRFDHIEIIVRLRSISDAQSLMDIIDELINNKHDSHNLCNLAWKLYTRIPVFPRSLFLKWTVKSKNDLDWNTDPRVDQRLKAKGDIVSYFRRLQTIQTDCPGK